MFVYISLLDGLRCRSKRKTKNGENSLVFSGKSHGCHFDIMKIIIIINKFIMRIFIN